eukprot:SAG31_NODE_15387_length_757_cov_2.001520_1_plen_43_part_10
MPSSPFDLLPAAQISFPLALEPASSLRPITAVYRRISNRKEKS